MTENEWLEATAPEDMLVELTQFELAQRKVRLFVCACCRRIWHLLSDGRCRRAIEIAERFADGLASKTDLEVVGDIADEAAQDAEDSELQHFKKLALVGSCNAAAFACSENIGLTSEAKTAAEWTVYAVTGSSPVAERNEEAKRLAAFRLEIGIQAHFLRDIFGNPFRQFRLDRSFLTSEVVSVAQKIYDTDDFELFSVLSDALTRAGCANKDILTHCRGAEPHVRGCWVIDAILGKK